MESPVEIATPSGLAEITDLFGNVSAYIEDDGIIDSQEMSEFLKTIELPFHMIYAYDRSIVIKRMTCHRILAPVFLLVFTEILKAGLDLSCSEFGGCYCYRPKRGSSKLSTHCWGIAVDLNPRSNPMGSKGDMNQGVVQIFKNHGFMWGGDWRKRDDMHFQFAKNY